MKIPVFLIALFGFAATVMAQEHTVTDTAGRSVDIPVTAQRIVVMHEPLLGIPLMDLGQQPVGSYGRNDDGSFLISVDFINTVLGEGHKKPKGFGPFGQLDLERLKALNPDLILATELDLGKVDQLSKIAPVYIQTIGAGKMYGFEVEQALAKLLGAEAAYEKRKADYTSQLQHTRSVLPSSDTQPSFLAIFLTDQINVVGSSSGVIQAFNDLGYKQLEITDARAPSAEGGSTLLLPISPEKFGQLNPDLLVLMNSYMTPDRDEAGTREKLSHIIPGWEQFLKPAKENRLLFLDPAKVITPSIASAEHTLKGIAEHFSNGQ